MHRSGDVLPPPADDYINSSISLTAKPVATNSSNVRMHTVGYNEFEIYVLIVLNVFIHCIYSFEELCYLFPAEY